MPTGLLKPTGSTHNIELAEWSADNRHVLLKHSYDGGNEYFVLDIEVPALSVNVTNALNVTGVQITLRDKKYDQYYVYNPTDKSLKTADLKNSVAAVYLSDVLAFQPYGSDVMLFATATGANAGQVWLKAREGETVYNLRQVSVGSKYLLDVARYDNNWYFAAGSTQDQRVYIFKNPVSASKHDAKRLPVPVAVLRSAGQAEFLSFSANSRITAVQNGKEFSVYDAETDRQYRYESDLAVEAGNKALWMDGHRLSIVANKKVVVFDFDGTNKQELVEALDGASAYFSQDWQDLLVLAPSLSVPGRVAVSSTSLRATP